MEIGQYCLIVSHKHEPHVWLTHVNKMSGRFLEIALTCNHHCVTNTHSVTSHSFLKKVSKLADLSKRTFTNSLSALL